MLICPATTEADIAKLVRIFNEFLKDLLKGLRNE